MQLVLDPYPWPRATVAAMEAGVLRGLAAAINAAAEERAFTPSELHVSNSDRDDDKDDDKCVVKCVDEWTLWLTGGDGPLLAPLLRASRRSWRLAPNLALDALASLALASLKPGPDP